MSLEKIRHVVLDMDGTIYLGNTLFPCTLPFLEKLRALGITYSFLTNNPSSSIQDYLAKLRSMGIACSAEQMDSAATATIDYIRENFPLVERIFALGTPSMCSQFHKAGFTLCGDSEYDEPQMVVVSFDRTLEYSRLCRCAWWISKDIPYIATNPDRVCPTDENTLLVDCGSICACLEAATHRKPDLYVGKPNPAILQAVLRRRGISAEECAVVGDRLYTDVQTALNAGACAVLVLSGESTMDTVREYPSRPTLICRDIEEFGNLLEQARI